MIFILSFVRRNRIINKNWVIVFFDMVTWAEMDDMHELNFIFMAETEDDIMQDQSVRKKIITDFEQMINDMEEKLNE